MIKKLSFILICIVVTLFSCSKEDAERLECETEDIGYVTITNTSDNPYDVYLDGGFVFRLSGNTFTDSYELNAGSHVLKAEQVSGYVIYPTIRETTVFINYCDKKSWVFP